MRTGPQKYPGATRGRHWYQDNYPGTAMESNVGVMHTTEGTSVPSYSGGASAPNFTALPDIGAKRLRWYQHFDFDVSSRALVNRAGGAETNTLNAVQIELVGTCDPRHRTSWNGRRAGRDYLYWPDAPDWALAELGEFVRWAYAEHGVQLRSDVTWKAYPGSYGRDNGVRLTSSEWRRTYGWVGHQHVVENLHGDPGNLDMARVLEHARGTAQEDDMPTAKEIASAVWNWDGVDPLHPTEDNPKHQPENVLTSMWQAIDRTERAVQTLAAKGAARDAVLARLAEGGGLDAAEVQAAAEAGARVALAELGEKLTEEG